MVFGSLRSLDNATRHALFGVAGMFFSHGFLLAIRAAYVPIIKRQLQATDADLAICLTAMGLGSLLAFVFASSLVQKLGSARATLYSIIIAAVMFAAQAYTFDLWAMVISLFVLGAVVGISDIAMNVQASVIEQRSDANYMTRIHACWSVGALGGSVVAGFLIEELSPAAFTIGFSVLSVVLAYATTHYFISEKRVLATSTKAFPLPPAALLPACFIAFMAMVAVVGIRDWAPIYLNEKLGSSLSVAVQTFAAFQATTALGRFFGDSVRAKFGDRHLLVAGGVLGCVAFFGGLASQSATGMFVALAVLGLAHANIFPALISIAGKHDPGHESRNLSAVMGLGYGGFIFAPIFIGMIAQAQGLMAGFATVAVASLLIAAAAYFQAVKRET